MPHTGADRPMYEIVFDLLDLIQGVLGPSQSELIDRHTYGVDSVYDRTGFVEEVIDDADDGGGGEPAEHIGL